MSELYATLDTLHPGAAKAAMKIALRAGRAVMLRGESGVGKTRIAEQVGAEEGYDNVLILHVAQMSDVDFRGIPVPDPINKTTQWYTPSFLPRSGRVLIVFDEVNRGLPSTVNAVMQLILDRKLGEYTLPEGCGIIACINPSGSNAGGHTIVLNQAFEGRFCHITIKPEVNDWLRWAHGAGIHPAVSAFIKFRPESLFKPVKGAYAWGNPRAFEFLSDLFRESVPKELELSLAAGQVGEDIAVPFIAFYRNYLRLGALVPNILMAPASAEVPEEGQLQFAVAGALVEHANPGNIGKILVYLERVGGDIKQFAVDAIIGRKPEVTHTADYIQWAVAHS